MVGIVDNSLIDYAVGRLYDQAREIIPGHVGSRLDFYRAITGIGSKANMTFSSHGGSNVNLANGHSGDIRARVLREGRDSGKLTLDVQVEGQWVELPGITRVYFVHPQEL